MLNDSVFSTHTGVSITTQTLTALPEFMSDIFTALIYTYTGKLLHDPR